MSYEEWAKQILAGDRRAIARAISAVENADAAGVALLKLLFGKASPAYVIGITGSPGVGKSTLVEKLALEYRRQGGRVGIVAVDPSSPFSGGAILGDRIRMQGLSGDEGVYIRSMATRGQLGGLAPAVHDVVAILEAAGCQVVLIETVGVGQDETEVARLADATALLLVPGMGDDVQTFKAGVMEIADVFVINKADRPGADRVEQEVDAMLSIGPRSDAWRPPTLKTVATTGEGIAALREALERFRVFGQSSALSVERQQAKWRGRLLELLRQTLFEKVVAERLRDGLIDRYVDEVRAHRRDPHSVVEEIIGESRRSKVKI
ncbi:MAG: methylmalonyl Co-A mutase-associated GTPase MeaB [Acidobacteria bacterium]|nr:MAG: methylmalonyl Co-A mutase-associated GTPase MeaB [Acidobacteriota bacterium]